MRSGLLTTTRILLAYSGAMLACTLLIATGVLDSLASDSHIDRNAIAVLVVYWATGCLAIVGMTKYRSHPREVLLMVATAVFALLIGEVLLRSFLLFPDKTLPREYFLASRRFHHVLPANKSMHLESPDGRPYSITTNEDGFRTRYSRDEFRRYGIRIAIMGDSFTYGLGVQGPFPDRMECFLRDTLRTEDIAVMNTGLTSYSPLLERAVYTGKLRSYKPTLVVLMLDATDIGDDYIYSGEAQQAGDSVWFERESEDTHVYRGALYHWLMPLLRYPFDVVLGWPSGVPVQQKRTYNYYEFELMVNGVKETNRFFIYRHSLGVTRKYFDRTLRLINSLAASVREDGGTFLLVVPPRYHHWSEKECPNDWGKIWYSRHEPHQFEYLNFFESVRDSVDYPILNMLPAFQGTEEFPLVFDIDPHWNEKGHAFVAKTLARHLLQVDLVRLGD